ncbi:MAG: class I SAM-dependent methyltransferase [Desulfacinum sp.]|nr:class I SAM-dependent methyltransferase [Desulfacinum sp.]MBZ4660585.1 class SAM-dependent methyltransferase [Desulfacinum sp.]
MMKSFETAWLVARAAASNQVARWAPSLYVSLTGQTGRGRADEEDPQSIAEYFFQCLEDYFRKLELLGKDPGTWLQGGHVLEYGPGDVLGMALLLYAHGAERVVCVDRFPLERLTSKNVTVYRALLERLDGARRRRAEGAFRTKAGPGSGFREECIDYCVEPAGGAPRGRSFDLILSRAVLEHVDDLETLFRNMRACLKENGLAVHKVDLESHGLDRETEFDFLTWPDRLYRMMYSHKGFPNRVRVDGYMRLARKNGFRLLHLEPTGMVETEGIERIKNRLPGSLRDVPADLLRWRGFWMILGADGQS